MPTSVARLNNYGYPYLPIPDEYLADLAKLEDPGTLNVSMTYDQYLSACGEYGSLYSWVESYHYEQYGPAPIDEEFDPDHITRLFERLDALAGRFYSVEKAPHLVSETLARHTPEGESNDTWALYAMATDPVSIGAIDPPDSGYPLLLRQLALAGDLETGLLVYCPVWFPSWLRDRYVRHPYALVGPTRPSPEEIEVHAAALRLWTPYSSTLVFNDYQTAHNAVKKTWQRTLTTPI